MLRNASHRRNFHLFLDYHHLPACYTRPSLNTCVHRFASVAASTKARTNGAATEPKKRFRSKHYNPTLAQPSTTTKKLLEPHVLSARLKAKCDEGRINDAISILKSSPLDAQNVPTWNTLIWECMKAQRFQVAYDLYTDMKRRGFSPTIRTFKTMFNGLARIEHWPDYPKQLKNANTLYEAFLRHADSVKKHNPTSSELDTAPISAYIQILGNAGMHQEIFDVFYNMDPEGPLAPDHILFTAMFRALAAKPDATTGYASNSASAKLLWSLVIKAQRKSKFPVDSHLASAAITALSRGRPTDQELAFQIINDYFALAASGESTSSKSIDTLPKDPIPLTPPALGAILYLCQHSEKHQLAIDFFQQVSKIDGGSSIIDAGHVETVLMAYASLSPPNYSGKCLGLLEWMLKANVLRRDTKLRPSYSTYLLVLKACWSCGDWRCAAKTFDLMTGYHCHDFMDGVVSDRPRFDARSEGRSFPPNVETVSLMVRTAVRAGNRAHIRQVLRLTHYLGMKDLFFNKFAPDGSSQSRKATENRVFFSLKLVDAVREGIKKILRENSGVDKPRPDDLARWKELEQDAAAISSLAPSGNIIPTVSVEKKRDRKTK